MTKTELFYRGYRVEVQDLSFMLKEEQKEGFHFMIFSRNPQTGQYDWPFEGGTAETNEEAFEKAKRLLDK